MKLNQDQSTKSINTYQNTYIKTNNNNSYKLIKLTSHTQQKCMNKKTHNLLKSEQVNPLIHKNIQPRANTRKRQNVLNPSVQTQTLTTSLASATPGKQITSQIQPTQRSSSPWTYSLKSSDTQDLVTMNIGKKAINCQRQR